jgi:hypothetical protein
MKLNFNFQFTGLDGKELKELKGETAGKILAGYISSLNKGNSIKLWDWAIKLYKGDELDLDASDLEVFIGLIDTSENLTVLSKAQILGYIDEVKQTEKKKK